MVGKENDLGIDSELMMFGERYAKLIPEHLDGFDPEAFWPIDVLALTEDDGTNPIVDSPEISSTQQGVMRTILWDTLEIGAKPPFRRYTFEVGEPSREEVRGTAHVRVFATNREDEGALHEIISADGKNLDWVLGTREDNYE